MHYPEGQFSGSQRRSLRGMLLGSYSSFYHCTPEYNREKIARSGLDIINSDPMKRYVNEPPVLRYCTKSELSRTYSMIQNYWGSNAKIIIAQVSSKTLLNCWFGLDWTYELTGGMARNLFGKDTERDLSADEAVQIVKATGYISCYETIPSNKVWFLSETTDDDCF